jgi:ribosome-associated protein
MASFELALDAAMDKKARDVVVLDLEGLCSFSDRFLICTGTSVRQTKSISDGVDEQLRRAGFRPAHIEGYSGGEWILMDYLDFGVHIFTERAREFYDLERLWRAGKRREVPEPAARQV